MYLSGAVYLDAIDRKSRTRRRSLSKLAEVFLAFEEGEPIRFTNKDGRLCKMDPRIDERGKYCGFTISEGAAAA